MAEVFLQWWNWCAKPPTAITLFFGRGLQVTARLARTQPPCMDPRAGSAIAVSTPLRDR